MEKAKKSLIGIIIFVLVVFAVLGILYYNLKIKNKKIEYNLSDGQSVVETGEGKNEVASTDKPSPQTSDNAEVKTGKEEEPQSNLSEALKQERTYEGFKIVMTKLYKTKDGKTTIEANVTNTSSESKKGQYVKLILLDGSGKELGSLPCYIKDLNAGESFTLHSEINEDYTNAIDCKIESIEFDSDVPVKPGEKKIVKTQTEEDESESETPDLIQNVLNQ